MRHLSTWLWLVPLAVHGGYLLATYDHLPLDVGAMGGAGTSRRQFIYEWLGIISAANIVFSIVYWKLPHLNDGMLAVPGKAFWLSTDERKAELIERLRGICEISLFGLNVFFLAVFQFIYQTNVRQPILSMRTETLVAFFVVLPLLAVVIVMLLSVRSLAAAARRQDRG